MSLENSKKLINNRIFYSVYYLLAYALMLFGYYKYIVPIFGYTGYEWSPDKAKIIEGVFLTFSLPLFLSTHSRKSSDILLHLQFLFPILPMIVLFGATGKPRVFLYAVIAAYLVVILISSNVHFRAMRIAKISSTLFQRLLLGLSLASIGSIILFGGLQYFNLDFSRVYELRTEAASNLPSIYGYISPIVSKVLLPFSLLLALLNKDKSLALLSILGSVLLFGLTTHKGTLFYPVAVIFFYYVLASKDVIKYLLISYLFLIGISILDMEAGGKWFGALFLDRLYFIPAKINYIYYDFFSSHPFFMWSHSKVSFGLSQSHYFLDPAHLIGLEYFSSELTGANTGWLGSGYMNAGYVGLFIYSIMVGLLLAMLNAFGRSIGHRVVVSIIIAPVMTVFLSSDLPTAFLNHGVIVSLILFTLFSTKRKRVTFESFS